MRGRCNGLGFVMARKEKAESRRKDETAMLKTENVTEVEDGIGSKKDKNQGQDRASQIH